MGIKRLLANCFVGLVVMAATHSVVVFAGDCLWYCDDQIGWLKDQVNIVGGGTQVIRCISFDAPYKDYVYTDDSTYDKRTLSWGTYHFKQYLGISCFATCEDAFYYPHKADGAPIGDILYQGNTTAYTCTMNNS